MNIFKFLCFLFSVILFPSVVQSVEISIKEETIHIKGGIEEGDDVKVLAALKRAKNPKLVVLTSEGGNLNTSKAISDLIIDYEIDTHAVGECSSGCTIIFLAGNKRTLERGSKLGFHRSSWSVSSLKEAYESSPEDWNNNIYEFAQWVDAVALEDAFSDLQYLLERGVEPQFAIKTMKAEAGDMWYPRRMEMRKAGLLTQ